MSPGTGLRQDAGVVPAASGSVTHSPWAERSRGRGPRGSGALPCCHPGWEPTSGDGRAPAASQQGRGIPPRPGRARSRGPVLPRPASGGQVPHGPTPRGSGPIWTRVQGLAGRSLCLRPPHPLRPAALRRRPPRSCPEAVRGDNRQGAPFSALRPRHPEPRGSAGGTQAFGLPLPRNPNPYEPPPAPHQSLRGESCPGISSPPCPFPPPWRLPGWEVGDAAAPHYPCPGSHTEDARGLLQGPGGL